MLALFSIDSQYILWVSITETSYTKNKKERKKKKAPNVIKPEICCTEFVRVTKIKEKKFRWCSKILSHSRQNISLFKNQKHTLVYMSK